MSTKNWKTCLMPTKRVSTYSGWIAFCVLLYCFFQAVWNIMGRGIEFTDEGKYLWDSYSPTRFEVPITHYGFVYHPIFKLLDFDIQHFRFFNFLLTIILSGVAVFLTLEKADFYKKFSRGAKYFITTALTLSSTVFYAVYWLPTPSYNSLTYLSLILAWIGFLFFINKPDFSRASPRFVLMIFSFSLLVLAKPSSYVALLFLFCLYFFWSVRFDYWFFQRVFVFNILFLATYSLVIYQSPIGLFRSILQGSKDASLRASGHDLVSLVTIDQVPRDFFLPIFLMFLSILGSFYSLKNKNYWLSFLNHVLVPLFFLGYLYTCFAQSRISTPVLYFFVPIGLLIGFSAYTFFEYKSKPLKEGLIILCVLPLVGAFGTNNNIWTQALLYTFFVVLFLFSFVVSVNPTKFYRVVSIQIALVLSLTLLISLFSAISFPYRQSESLLKYDHELKIVEGTSTLLVTKNFKSSIEAIEAQLLNLDFKPGTPVIDLTGDSPTILYIMQALPLGDSWLVGGYPGSEEFAIAKLKQHPCQILSSAWLLTEPNAFKELNPMRVLSRLGLDVQNFKVVASWEITRSQGGEVNPSKQLLLQPDNKTVSCS